MVMKKLTSLMLGLIIGIASVSFIHFIDRLLDATNLNISKLINYDLGILPLWFALIFTPIIFFFLLRNSYNLKQKIVRTTFFLIGNLLGFIMLFFYIIEQCGYDYPSLFPTKDCIVGSSSLIPTIIFITILGIDIIYLIFRFVKYKKNQIK